MQFLNCKITLSFSNQKIKDRSETLINKGKYEVKIKFIVSLIEDNDYNTWFFKNRKFIRFEVKPNPWHIEFLEFRRGEGFFAIGKRLDLLRRPPLNEMVNI